MSSLRARIVAAFFAGLAFASPARAETPIYWDGRDAYTLLRRHPVNRQVLEQQALRPERALSISDRVAVLADLSIGTQQSLTGGPQTRFHGYFVADTYVGARLVPGLEANVNLLLLGASASDGYRRSAAVLPGIALHARYPIFRIGGHDVRVDAYGTDLGWVTVGRGLLLEQTPLEGVAGGVSWRDVQLRGLYGGRALWGGDDFVAYVLSLFERRAELTLVQWKQRRDDPFSSDSEKLPTASYATASFEQPLGNGFRTAAELATKLDSPIRPAALVRFDYLKRAEAFSLHSGYQMRVYQHGFSPRRDDETPTWPFSTPAAEDVYVTNPIEYYHLARYAGISSHTLMLEAEARMTKRFELFAEAEQWLRFVAVRGPLGTAMAQEENASVTRLELYFKGGIRFYPWEGQRHRASLYATNKQIEAGVVPTQPIERRFRPDHAYWLLTLEAFL